MQGRSIEVTVQLVYLASCLVRIGICGVWASLFNSLERLNASQYQGGTTRCGVWPLLDWRIWRKNHLNGYRASTWPVQYQRSSNMRLSVTCLEIG